VFCVKTAVEFSEESPFFCRLLLCILFTNSPCYIGIMYEIPAFFTSTLGRKKEELQWQWL